MSGFTGEHLWDPLHPSMADSKPSNQLHSLCMDLGLCSISRSKTGLWPLRASVQVPGLFLQIDFAAEVAAWSGKLVSRKKNFWALSCWFFSKNPLPAVLPLLLLPLGIMTHILDSRPSQESSLRGWTFSRNMAYRKKGQQSYSSPFHPLCQYSAVLPPQTSSGRPGSRGLSP